MHLLFVESGYELAQVTTVGLLVPSKLNGDTIWVPTVYVLFLMIFLQELRGKTEHY